MLDQSIEEMLDKINETFFQKKRRLRRARGLIRQIAEHRLAVVLDFEALMDPLQLIGWVILLIGYLYLYLLDVGWIAINTP